MIASVMIARLAAELQRTINATLQGRPMHEYPNLVATPTAKARHKILMPLKDPQSWLDIIWVIAGFPIALILSDEGHEVVGSVSDGDAMVDACLETCPDLTISDIRMPPSHRDEGLRAAIRIRE